MASPVDICNLALSHLGEAGSVASIDPPEASSQARLCARYYPLARDSAIETHAWGFATRRAQLAPVVVPPAYEGEWAFAYAKPNLCLRLWQVYVPGLTEPGRSEDFAEETAADGSSLILTNAEGAFGKYVVSVTDTTRYPPSFVNYLSFELAGYLVIPITRSAEQHQSIEGRKAQARNTAVVQDARSNSVDQMLDEQVPDWLSARR